jgi:hypothetical protein
MNTKMTAQQQMALLTLTFWDVTQAESPFGQWLANFRVSLGSFPNRLYAQQYAVDILMPFTLI